MRTLAFVCVSTVLAACAGGGVLPLDGPFGGDAGAGSSGSGTGTGTSGIVIIGTSGSTASSDTGGTIGVSTTAMITSSVDTSSTGTISTSSSSDTGGGAPTTCSEADNSIGCCFGSIRYYCSGGALTSDDCASSGKVCSWSTKYSNYGCLTGTATADPSGTYPLACGGTGSGSSTSSSSTSTSSTSTSSMSTSTSSSISGAPTWTELYTMYLAVGTVGDCDSSSCHHHTECSSASACYSWLGHKQLSGGGGLLTWDNGYMPPNGPSSDSAAEAAFTAWTAAGAQDN